MAEQVRLTSVPYKLSDEKLPVFKESQQNKIVFYGEQNDYPERLIYFYNRSPKHNAILTHKAKFINGKETIVEGGSEDVLIDFNSHGTLKESKYKSILDKKIFGAFCFECIPDKAGNFVFYHMPVSKVRTLDHKSYQFWPNGAKTKKEDVKTYPAFDPKKKVKSIWYLQEYRADMGVYSLPEYIGAIQYIDIDCRISNFHLKNIMTGFSAGTMVQFFIGEPTPEQARAAKKAFRNGAQGDENGGEVILQWNEPGGTPAEVTPLHGNELDQKFLMLNEHVQQEIFVGHQITSPMLLGVKTEGQLGGLQEMANAYEIFYNTYIEPEQQYMDGIYTKIINYMGNKGKIKTLKAEPIGQDYRALYRERLITLEYAQENLGLPVEKIEPEVKEQKFSDEELAIYAQFGESGNDYEDLQMDFTTDAQKAHVLSVVSQTPGININSLSEQTHIQRTEVEKILKELQGEGQLRVSKGAAHITTAGNAKVQSEGLGKLIVKYRYEVDPTAPPLLGHSRPFCEKLIALNRVYTRDDINSLSARLGYDVWARRGGWYHNYEKDVNVPHCRHFWRPVIMRRK